MKIINWLEKYLEENAPYDYKKYVNILYDFHLNCFRRKKRALKFLIKNTALATVNKVNRSIGKTELDICQRPAPYDCYTLLKKYDVISFDIFDTLILRAISTPEDIFYLTGIKLQIEGFSEIRILAEQEARLHLGVDSSDDVTIYDIYSVLSHWCNINAETGIQAELDVENSICSANPYWLEIVKKLSDEGKKIIATTDMYLQESHIRTLLEKNGYGTTIEKIFVSCETGASKRNGRIYDVIKDRCGKGQTYIHIGDHYVNDCKMAKRKGWNSLYYKNVHSIGKKYRDIGKGLLPGSIADGILDIALHNGIKKYDPLEAFGFLYYGKLHVGYCQWLEQFAKEKGIDKLLFISRDGYLLRKLYHDFFPAMPNEYVYASRFALSQITIAEDPNLFLRQNLEPKAIQGTDTIGNILQEFHLEFLCEKIEARGLQMDDLLNRKNYADIQKVIYANRITIADSLLFKESRQAAELYFSEIISGCSSICIVDVGWYGTCTRGIYNFIKKNMKWKGAIYGVQIGIECGRQNIQMYAQGILNAYVFAPDFNRSIYKKHDSDIGNVIDEIVFSAPEPSLYRYRLDSASNVTFEFSDEPPENIEMVRKLQHGVYEYVKQYCDIEKKLGMKLVLKADTAYAPAILVFKKRQYINQLLGSYYVHRNASGKFASGIYTRDV